MCKRRFQKQLKMHARLTPITNSKKESISIEVGNGKPKLMRIVLNGP